VFAVRVHLDAPFDIISLGTLTGEHGTAKARSINNLNVSVGDSLNAAGKLRAVRFETNGTVTDLGTLGGDSSTAVAINDHGIIAGESKNTADQTRGFIFGADGIMRDIGTLGGSETFVTAINNRGEIIGQSFTKSGALEGFVFANGQMQPLGTLGGNESSALGINDAGVIVGSARKVNGALAPFIKYPAQPMQDLAALIPRIHQDELISARAINNRGSILAVGLERFSEEIPEMGGEILALDEAEGTGNIRSDLSCARQRSPAAKDPDPFRKFVLRTALVIISKRNDRFSHGHPALRPPRFPALNVND
jgi:probable HAF family extracellular repeat protein